jgi:hypothetical protein
LADGVADAYRNNLVRLLKLASDRSSDAPAVLELSESARELLIGAEERLEPDLMPFGRLGGIADWASKWIGLVLRNAGRLHLADWVTTEKGDPLAHAVSERTMRRALEIGKYQIHHALVAFG